MEEESVEALTVAAITPEFSITSAPAPPSRPTAAAVAVVPASPKTAPASPIETFPASAVALPVRVMSPLLRIVSLPSPPAMPVARAEARLPASESP